MDRALIALTGVLLSGIGSPAGSASQPAGVWWQPSTGLTWQWQLQGELNLTYDVEAYDIDLFATKASTILALQAAGRRVICYFSAGSAEEWRPDYDQFTPEVKGAQLEGWPDEVWVDIRATRVRDIMMARLDMAASKGCDAVEPDNVDAYTNEHGFADPITAADQLDYNRFLAAEAHARGLAVALKNDLDQVPELVSDFDMAINDQCHEYEECDALRPFIAAGKPVLNAELVGDLAEANALAAEICAAARAANLSTLILPLELDDSFRVACD